MFSINVGQLILLLIIVFIGSLFITAGLKKYAISKELIDVPNPRSSHHKATPKGGGLAIVITFLAGTIFLSTKFILSQNMLVGILGGGILIALIGWWDDHGHVAVWLRLAVHLVVAIWVLGLSGGMPSIDIGGVSWNLGWIGYISGVLLLVWFINLYNFMDGIDGLAAVEAIFVAGVSGILLTASGAYTLGWVLWILTAATAGFLFWNWPPARIFMGDVGSGFLGFIFGASMLSTAHQKIIPIWSWLILLGVFLTDATLTLIRRILHGSRWYQAHRRHAYQHAARRWSHMRVTIGISVINLFWLAPLSWIVWRWPHSGVFITFLALAPLVFLAFYFKAGLET